MGGRGTLRVDTTHVCARRGRPTSLHPTADLSLQSLESHRVWLAPNLVAPQPHLSPPAPQTACCLSTPPLRLLRPWARTRADSELTRRCWPPELQHRHLAASSSDSFCSIRLRNSWLTAVSSSKSATLCRRTYSAVYCTRSRAWRSSCSARVSFAPYNWRCIRRPVTSASP